MLSDRTQQEFARQAAAMASAAIFNAQDVLKAIVEASGHGPAKTVLDVGCGPGIVVEALAKQGGKVVGIDVTPEMIQQGRQRCGQAGLANAEFILGPAETLPFPSGSFDGVVSRLALHHVSDPAKVVGEMSRVLRSGGRMVLADIVASENPVESELHNAIETLRDPSHVRMMPLSEFVSIAGAADLALLAQKQWDQHRQFEEWVKIANAPEREQPLKVVMENLARAGLRAGIDLQCRDGRITFCHRLTMLVARKP